MSSPPHILLVEGDEAHATAMRKALSHSHGKATVHTARNWAEARQHVESCLPDLIIADLLVTDRDAPQWTKDEDSHSRFPLILLTDEYGEKAWEAEVQWGAIDLVLKSPAAFEALPHIVRRALRKWRLVLENRDAQRALKNREQLFRAVFDTSSDYMCIKDRNLRYVEVNGAFATLCDKPREWFQGRSAGDIVDKHTAELVEQLDREVLRGKHIERQVKRKVDNREITLLDIRTPLRNSQGEIEGVAAVSHDITELIHANPPGDPVAKEFNSEAMKKCLREAKLAGRNGRTFLLQGESGTGKDFLARWIHDNSQWSAGPFFSVNCAALSPELAESELFGHEAGSFTGAARRKRGMLELAQGGTLLLNEIGEMPLPLQAKLLVFLDTKKFVRVGGEKEVSVDAAIIAASHRHLRQEVQDGRFLEALYYRLAVLTLDIPPLRQRLEDIPILVENLLSVISKHLGIKHHFVVSPEDMDKMKRYSWPGNVRELRNLLERSMMLWAGGPFCLEIPSTDGKSQEKTQEHARHELPDQLLTCTLHEATDHIRTILCAQALHQHDGNKVRAARALGISRDALYRYIKKFDLGGS